MDTFGGIVLYLSLLGLVVGLVSIAVPLRIFGIRTRKGGFATVIAAILGFTAGVFLPVTEKRIEVNDSRLDEFMPVFQFNEFHSTLVKAPKNQVYLAIHEVKPKEIQFFRTLMWIRFLSSPPEDTPVLRSFTSGWFTQLADDRDREFVFGLGAQRNRQLGMAESKMRPNGPPIKIVMNFRIRDADAKHCLLSTETRVYAVGTHARRGFATYWRIIRPGSAFIRRMWLRAIRLRAEAATTTTSSRPL